MPTVAVMLAGAAAQALAAEQIGSLASVRFCETVGSLQELVAAADVDAVVADLRDISGDSILPAFGALRPLLGPRRVSSAAGTLVRHTVPLVPGPRAGLCLQSLTAALDPSPSQVVEHLVAHGVEMRCRVRRQGRRQRFRQGVRDSPWCLIRCRPRADHAR